MGYIGTHGARIITARPRRIYIYSRWTTVQTSLVHIVYTLRKQYTWHEHNSIFSTPASCIPFSAIIPNICVPRFIVQKSFSDVYEFRNNIKQLEFA